MMGTSFKEQPAKSTVQFKQSSPKNMKDDDDKIGQDSSNDNYTERSSTTEHPSNTIADKENQQVKATRLLMLSVFFAAGAGFGLITFSYTRDREQLEFEDTFTGLAEEVILVSQINMNNNFGVLEGLSELLTSYAIGNNASWPFVTHPNWPAVSDNAVKSFNARFVSYVPFVDPAIREDWEDYTVEQQGWIQDAIDFVGGSHTADPIIPFIFNYDDNLEDPFVYQEDPPPEDYPFHVPLWQTTLLENPQFVNYEGWNDVNFKNVTMEMVDFRDAVMSHPYGEWDYDPEAAVEVPESLVCQPIFDDFGRDTKLVGVLDASIQLNLFDGILSEEGSDGIYAVLENKCSNPTHFTWMIRGQEAEYLGQGDLHQNQYTRYGVHANATALRTTGACPYLMHMYPSREFEKQFETSDTIVYTVATVMIFLITTCCFSLYNFLVEKRQDKVLISAQKSGAIVDSLFPAAIRDRLMEDEKQGVFGFPIIGGKKGEHSNAPKMYSTKPIADYYPVGTVMVADIANFLAWSSVREPSQVFTLLETLYTGFDSIAKRRRIFKVETLADRYVACANVPDAREDHAMAMARFAIECRDKMIQIVRQLEIWLGPDTSTLRMRFAINTGPLTAGVLRGTKSRFQLFGSTIDLCFKLEARGEADEIHLAQSTADLIMAGDKGSWLTPRAEKVFLKGRGEVQTYWLDRRTGEDDDDASSNFASAELMSVGDNDSSRGSTYGQSMQEERLINWNVDVLSRLLKMIIAMRDDGSGEEVNDRRYDAALNQRERKSVLGSNGESTVLDEVKEIIALRSDEAAYKRDPASVELDPAVEEQLLSYVRTIASLYQPNPFHNFQHACHVTQSVTKLLSRVVTPDEIDTSTMTYKHKKEASALHSLTYGITSDPMIQFACALSALIHDVDHPGVPNMQLVKEQTRHAKLYKKSVAEQNSVDLAWSILMEEEYAELRKCIYSNQEELDRFRQLVVNSVMATDIVDKELGALRKNRWKKAFSADDEIPLEQRDTKIEKIHRKGTIVIEHLVQAADVSHMMQHWHVYIKWNERFFRECYQAFLDGRADKDPSEGWYKGELGFFEFYVIPLARKLEDCGVFGVSSDEFLNYAEANHREWQMKGEQMVEKYLSYFQKNNG